MKIKSVIEFMNKLFTRENVTFALSLFGSAGAFYTFVSKMILNRVKIEVSIIEYVPASDSVILYMMFVNKSHLPITITDVNIWNDSIVYSCSKSPKIVRIDTNGSKITGMHKETIYTLPIPANLPSLSGTSGYLFFQIPQGNFRCDSKSLTVEISTNRHRKFQKTLSLPGN